MTCRLICGPKRLDKNTQTLGGREGGLTPETPNLIRRDKLITMTDERLFTSPQRKAAVGQKKRRRRSSWTANIADLLAREDKRRAGGMEVKKHIVRYYRFPGKRSRAASLGTCPGADCDTYPRCARWARLEDPSSPLAGSTRRSRWNEAVIHGVPLFAARRRAPWDWCSPSPPLPFAAGEGGEAGGGFLREGSADLKCWWRWDSDGAQGYIFIILQSAPKTLSLVFKVPDGPTAAGAVLPTWRLSFRRLPAGGCVGLLSAALRWLLQLGVLE